jgi:SpoIIAA-like
MHEITEDEGNVVTVKVSGTLTSKDYDDLIPAWKKVIAKHGSMRMLFVMHDFHGWDAKAAWEDFSFDRAYSDKVERVAMVGEKSWQKWMTKIGSVFVKAQVQYFDSNDLAQAERWVRAT